MLTIKEVIKTLYNALLQRLKKHRGNWDQNDPSAEDYIKNRPFYTDETKKTVNVPEQKITIPSGNPAQLVLPELIEFVVGQTYEVKWDNKTYSCVAFDMNGIGVIGNPGVFGNGTDTGEPFIMMISKAEGMGMVAAPAGTHTVEVASAKIIKLDKKYLPDLGLAPVATSGNYWDLEDIPTDVVRYGTAQDLTDTQKARVRTNIGAVAASDLATVATTGDYNDLENKPCAKIIANSDYRGVSSYRYTTTAPSGISFGYSDYWDYRIKNNYIDNPFSFIWEGTHQTRLYTTPYANCVQLSSTQYLWGNASLWDSSLNNTNEVWCVILETSATSVNKADRFYWYVGTLTTQNYDLQFSEQTTTITQLSEELIPDTITRTSDLAAVATTGSYNDLTEAPTKNVMAANMGETITWDGNTEGLIRLNGEPFYKLLDYCPSVDEIMNSTARIVINGEVKEGIIKYSERLHANYKDIFYYSASFDSSFGAGTALAIVPEHYSSPEPGLYFYYRWYSSKDHSYLSSLTLNGKALELTAPVSACIPIIDQVNGYKYYVCIREGNLATYCATKSIHVSVMPNKIEYAVGETFDPAGMSITAKAYDGTVKEITEYTYQTEPLVEGTTSIEVVFIENEASHTVNVPITITTV